MRQRSGKGCDGKHLGQQGPRPGDSRAPARTEAAAYGPNARLKSELDRQIDELLLPGGPTAPGHGSPWPR